MLTLHGVACLSNMKEIYCQQKLTFRVIYRQVRYKLGENYLDRGKY